MQHELEHEQARIHIRQGRGITRNEADGHEKEDRKNSSQMYHVV